jgi:hypothetical protein
VVVYAMDKVLVKLKWLALAIVEIAARADVHGIGKCCAVEGKAHLHLVVAHCGSVVNLQEAGVESKGQIDLMKKQDTSDMDRRRKINRKKKKKQKRKPKKKKQKKKKKMQKEGSKTMTGERRKSPSWCHSLFEC